MAFNRTDTRQRAYNKIDAYQPHGNWVDERSYNRAKKGCLMGNWYEESSLCTPGGEEPAVHKVIAGERTMRGQGGFQSTKFLISPELNPNMKMNVTTTAQHYTPENADCNAFRPEKFGSRRGRQVDEVIDTAKRSLHVPKPAPHEYRTSYNSSTGNVNPTEPPLGTLECMNKSRLNMSQTEDLTTTGPIDSFDYTLDEPITVYSGNPRSGMTMSVQGTTAGTGKSKFARNCNFSTPIDRHPIGGKHQTPQF